MVTYADSDQGHVGTVYQAVNGTYTGQVGQGNLYLRDRRGGIRTMQSLKRHGTWSQRRAVARELGWLEHRSGGKHRYVLLLGSARERRRYPGLCWAALPYPKRPVDTRCRPALTPRLRWCRLAMRSRPRPCTGLSASQSARLGPRRDRDRDRMEGRGPPIRSARSAGSPGVHESLTASRLDPVGPQSAWCVSTGQAVGASSGRCRMHSPSGPSAGMTQRRFMPVIAMQIRSRVPSRTSPDCAI